jgi:hypothetical protein
VNSKAETLEKIGQLVAELKAVERWNAEQWTLGCTDSIETLAMEARRIRRGEILVQLNSIICVLDRNYACYVLIYGPAPGANHS